MDFDGLSSAEAPTSSDRAAVDYAVLRGSLSGERDAFSLLYDRLSPSLFSMVFEIVKDQKDAEDVLQEAFVQIWKKRASYDAKRGTVFTWSVMIARSKAIDRVRARRRRQQLAEAAAAEAEAVPRSFVCSAADLYSQRDDRERVREALGRLSVAQRTAIELAFFSGLTQNEIAGRLDQPLGTIKARIRRGLLALRDGLMTADFASPAVVAGG